MKNKELNYLIRAAELDDAAAICLLVNSAYRGEGSKEGWTTEAALLDGIRIDIPTLNDLITELDTKIWLYFSHESELLGTVCLQKKAEQLYLGMLTVSPKFQNRKIGSILLSHAEAQARQLNCQLIYMSVISVRGELIQWYQKKGYQLNGKTLPFPNDPKFGIPKMPLHFVELEKKLDEI